jgi:integrative and conjugative element protein (TIGR02256 family)
VLQFLKSSQRLLLTTKSGWQVALSEDVLQQLHGYRQTGSMMPEAGGVLLGKLLQEGGTGIVEALTKPGRGDRQSRFGFFRSERHHRETQSYWRTTAQTGAYLGLWHTHPEPVPTPSAVDLADWKRALRQDLYPGQGLLFVIVGTDAVGFWIGGKRKRIELIGHWPWELNDV